MGIFQSKEKVHQHHHVHYDDYPRVRYVHYSVPSRRLARSINNLSDAQYPWTEQEYFKRFPEARNRPLRDQMKDMQDFMYYLESNGTFSQWNPPPPSNGAPQNPRIMFHGDGERVDGNVKALGEVKTGQSNEDYIRGILRQEMSGVVDQMKQEMGSAMNTVTDALKEEHQHREKFKEEIQDMLGTVQERLVATVSGGSGPAAAPQRRIMPAEDDDDSLFQGRGGPRPRGGRMGDGYGEYEPQHMPPRGRPAPHQQDGFWEDEGPQRGMYGGGRPPRGPPPMGARMGLGSPHQGHRRNPTQEPGFCYELSDDGESLYGGSMREGPAGPQRHGRHDDLGGAPYGHGGMHGGMRGGFDGGRQGRPRGHPPFDGRPGRYGGPPDEDEEYRPPRWGGGFRH